MMHFPTPSPWCADSTAISTIWKNIADDAAHSDNFTRSLDNSPDEDVEQAQSRSLWAQMQCRQRREGARRDLTLSYMRRLCFNGARGPGRLLFDIVAPFHPTGTPPRRLELAA